MKRRFGRMVAAVAAVGTALAGAVVVTAGPVAAADSDVVINELMTKAGPATDPAFEFIELYNNGSQAVDVSGWAFSAGITLDPTQNPMNTAGTRAVFPAGKVIPAHGYFVGSSNTGVFSAVSGRTADFSFAPSGLSSSGETVTLVDEGEVTMDGVTYAASSPWPSSPNGTGPSLELVDPALDNTVATNWGASTGANGTPGAKNSIFAAPPPTLTGVSVSPSRPTAGQNVTVQATMPAGSTATLVYKVMFGSDVSIPFTDDAASVGGADDGTFSAAVPGTSAGRLVRYKIDAMLGSTPVSWPAVGDSRTYDGFVVRDPSLNSAQLPVLEWFLDDQSYQSLSRPVCDGVEYVGVITWQGQVFDNSVFRRRGQASCTDPEPKIDMGLPSGYLIDFSPFSSESAAPFTGPVDEWALQDEAYPVPGLGWENVRSAGDPQLGYMSVRTQRNAAFHSVGAVLEKYDGTWRKRNGHDDGSLYKVDAGGLRTYPSAAALATSLDLDKKDPDDGDYSDAWQLTQVLSQSPSAAKTAWIYDHVDVPQVVNYMAITVELRHWDSGGKNFYIYRDASNTERWQVLHWDLDGILSAGSDTKGDFVTPDTSFNKLYKSMLEIPTVKEMYFRRLRTLHDTYLAGNGIVNQFDALTVGKDADRVLDRAKWGGSKLSSKRNKVVAGVQERRTKIAAHTNASEVPTSQAAAPSIVINEIQYRPGTSTGDEEYLELYNPSATASIDISGWRITGVGSSDTAWAIPPGTVVPKSGYVVFVGDDVAFRAEYGPNHFVGGQFPGGLSSSGEQIQLLNGSGVVDEVTYGPLAPWPTAPNGSGPSLELTNPTLDNSSPTSWAASTNSGTPGALNSVAGGGSGSNPIDFGDSWRYLTTGGDQGTAWRSENFDDSGWQSGAGTLGFRNSNLTTTIPATSGRTTYYFRSGFSVTNAATISAATLRMILDDGAVVYINGVEVARLNLPGGTVGFTTKPLASVGGAAENTPVTVALPISAFHNGTNTIAVEVHNRGIRPGDLSFDGALSFNVGGG